MEEQFVPYEIALKLNEFGFNEKCLASYFVFSDGTTIHGNYGKTEPELFIFGIDSLEDRENKLQMFAYNVVSAPLWQQVRKWLLHKQGINLTVNWTFYDEFHYFSKYTFPDGSYGNTETYCDTPEESEAQGLIKVLELLEERIKSKLWS
jgi:hypothetical protein